MSSHSCTRCTRLVLALVATIAVGALLLTPPASAGKGDRGDFDPGEWMAGADGLFDALKRVDKEKKPLVVYFNTDWCGYCRQFERELLGTHQVRDFLRSTFAVLINPDKGTKEGELARYYGVQGYPSFFVYGHTSQRLARVERYRVVGGKPELLSPEEFVAAIKEASAR